MTEKMTDLVAALIEAGAFDSLAGGAFAGLSMSRMGQRDANTRASWIYESLVERGLAKETEDGVSIPLHPAIRNLYLVILAQQAREAGAKHQLDLHPVTNSGSAAKTLRTFLNLEPMPTRSQVAAFDLEVVTIDLEQVPLDEVLQFKRSEDSNPQRVTRAASTLVQQSSSYRPLLRWRLLASAMLSPS
jgi:hypothetical protein